MPYCTKRSCCVFFFFTKRTALLMIPLVSERGDVFVSCVQFSTEHAFCELLRFVRVNYPRFLYAISKTPSNLSSACVFSLDKFVCIQSNDPQSRAPGDDPILCGQRIQDLQMICKWQRHCCSASRLPERAFCIFVILQISKF